MRCETAFLYPASDFNMRYSLKLLFVLIADKEKAAQRRLFQDLDCWR